MGFAVLQLPHRQNEQEELIKDQTLPGRFQLFRILRKMNLNDSFPFVNQSVQLYDLFRQIFADRRKHGQCLFHGLADRMLMYVRPAFVPAK